MFLDELDLFYLLLTEDIWGSSIISEHTLSSCLQTNRYNIMTARKPEPKKIKKRKEQVTLLHTLAAIYCKVHA